MKKMSMATVLTFAVAVTGVYAQSQTESSRSNPPTAQASAIDARAFVNRLAIAGMTEVQLGQLAAERAQSTDVKAFGQMMVKDHTQAGNELMQIAKQSNIPWPTQLDQEHRDLVNRLSKLQGAAFDREYINVMASGHQEVANELRARAGSRLTSTMPAQGEPSATPLPGTSGNQATGRVPDSNQAAVGTTGGASPADQAVTQWATKALPTVQRHLARAQELQQRIK
jgi:predicted outer membrane protein